MTPTGWHCLTETATEEWARLSERGASQPYFYLVAHGIFGLVLDRFGGGRGPDARVQVSFGGNNMKWLALEYAKLKVV